MIHSKVYETCCRPSASPWPLPVHIRSDIRDFSKDCAEWMLHIVHQVCAAGRKKIEKDRNWGIGKDRAFLSFPTHHFAPPKTLSFSIATLIRAKFSI